MANDFCRVKMVKVNRIERFETSAKETFPFVYIFQHAIKAFFIDGM